MRDQWGDEIQTLEDLLKDAWYYTECGLLDVVDGEFTLSLKGVNLLTRVQ